MDKRTESKQSRGEIMNDSQGKRRKKRRFREMILFVGGALGACALLIVVLILVFQVKEIRVVNSAERYSDEQILTASGLEAKGSTLLQKRREAARQIEQSLPYIGRAEVKGYLSDTLTITVTYTRDAFAVESPGGYVLLNDACKVLQTDSQTVSDYVALLKGVSLTSAVAGHPAEFSDPDMATYIRNLNADFAKHGFYNVTAYDFSDLLNVMAEIDYRVVVKLGNISKAESRLKFGKAVIDRTLELVHQNGSHQLVDLTIDKTAFVDAVDEDGSIIHATTGVRLEPETEDEQLSSVEPSSQEEDEEPATSPAEEEDEAPDEEKDSPEEEPEEEPEEDAGAPEEDGEAEDENGD